MKYHSGLIAISLLIVGSLLLLATGSSFVFADSVGTSVTIGEPIEETSGGGGGGGSPNSRPLNDSSAPVVFDLEIEDITPTTIVLSFRTNEPSYGYIDYRMESDLVEQVSESVDGYQFFHTFRLTNLIPGARYVVRARALDMASHLFQGNYIEISTIPLEEVFEEEQIADIEETDLVDKPPTEQVSPTIPEETDQPSEPPAFIEEVIEIIEEIIIGEPEILDEPILEQEPIIEVIEAFEEPIRFVEVMIPDIERIEIQLMIPEIEAITVRQFLLFPIVFGWQWFIGAIVFIFGL